MKQSSDPRHKKRVAIIKHLFGLSFHKDQHQAQHADTINDILNQKDAIDEIVQKCAPEWPLSQINRVDLAVLRLAVYELLAGKVPYKVTIDEAVEIAKQYGSKNSGKFVNGVLGTALKYIDKHGPQQT